MAERPLGAAALYEALLRAYGEPRWWSEDAYTVLFQSVLVQNTAWGNVEKTCAAIGGRLKPEVIGDDRMVLVARDIVKKIENDLDYPGQIKVHVIRESRAIEYAR